MLFHFFIRRSCRFVFKTEKCRTHTHLNVSFALTLTCLSAAFSRYRMHVILIYFDFSFREPLQMISLLSFLISIPHRVPIPFENDLGVVRVLKNNALRAHTINFQTVVVWVKLHVLTRNLVKLLLKDRFKYRHESQNLETKNSCETT